ncbi:MAG: PorP/SprF family type IX secretion system membrane protein [Bacteroidia bacterium]
MKTINKKLIGAALSVLIVSGSLKAQDPRYSQVFANPLRLNPAIMGANTDVKVGAIYRNQWADIGGGYSTMALSAMMPLFVSDGKGKLDLGLSVLGDKAGAFQQTDAALSIGYSVQLAPYNNLSLAISCGFVQNNLNTSGLTYDSQYSMGSYSAGNASNEKTLTQHNTYADLGFGLMWFMNPSRETSKLNAYVGISGFHLNQPNQTFLGSTNGKLAAKYGMQAGIKILGSKGFDVSPNVRVFVQNGNLEAAVGTYVDYCVSDKFKFVVGVWYRTENAAVVMAGIEHQSFTLGYSYDISAKPLTTYFSGVNANEISLCWKISRLSKNKMESFGGGSATPSVKNNLFENF